MIFAMEVINFSWTVDSRAAVKPNNLCYCNLLLYIGKALYQGDLT